jgi:ribonuclease G
MSKEIYISSTPHETRLAIVEDEALTEIYYERENEYTLAGSIYNGRVTRVLPGMQSSFVDIGLERDAFLYITDFLEETPDAEEFDTAPAGDRAPRQPRLGNGEQGGDASGRGERGGRGRRGGRDRDRNAGNNGESPAGSEAPRQLDSERGPNDSERNDVAHNDVGSAAPREVGEIGEGAPGADGSRRWRGRRGRRRGRADRPATDQTQENSARGEDNSQNIPSDAQGYTGAASYDYDSSYNSSPIEIDGETAASTDASSNQDLSGDRSGGRGRRDRNRGGQRRDGQRYEAQRNDSPRAPRGFEPRHNSYGDDGGESSGTGPIANAYPDEIEAGAVPIILPGESLSKYRKETDEPSIVSSSPKPVEPTTVVTLAPPANLFTLATGWDGGSVLPGETLARRNSSESRSDTRNDSRQQSRGGSRNDSHDGRRDWHDDSRPDCNNSGENRPDNRSQNRNEAVIATVSAAATVPQGFEPVAEGGEDFNQKYVAEVHIEETPVVVEEQAAALEPVVETEYEPQEASASYRVDPVAPSEFRQSAPVLEGVLNPHADEVAKLLAPDAEVSAVAEATSAAEAEESVIEVHDVTSITSCGEMHSDSVAAPDEVLATEAVKPEAIELPKQAAEQLHVEPTTESIAYVDVGFAPGVGQLDEEILDEEEFEGTTIQASAIEEMDDFDEEAVEGAVELGNMLREMSIDQITRTAPEVEEQDDLDEEEDFEEDDLDEEGADEEDEDDSEIADESNNEFDEATARTGTTADAEFFDNQFGQTDEAIRTNQQNGNAEPRRSDNRDSSRRGGRRDGRRGRNDRGDRPRSTGGFSDREHGGLSGGGHSGGGRGRHSMQTTDLPAISDLLKPGQEILVQIAKEPIAKKGARITSHIALPGRFLVFMPTVNHTGVSRKIESDGERRRLKEILLSEKGDATGGFIVRTAAEGASEEELRSDLRFLLNLWADIKSRSESSKSPALIYHDLNLVERILRDQVTDNFSAIWVDTEDAYERVLRFLQRFQPSLIRRVKLYTKDTPLFEQFGITEEINKALRSKVWLKSGGSIVINQTEALVAIDINTGKYVGKTARLEDTIVKTNLDAIPEIVRQIRLRDLGGIIIIDFIDMDERKNRNRVMAALEEELKSDRAPSKVLQFNDFGLVAITRKRVKQSLERTLSTPCIVCEGTGMVKSPITVCNDIYIEMRKMHKHLDRGDVMLRVHPEVVKQLKTSGAKWLLEMEEMVGKTILVKSDPALHPEQFDIH